MKARADDRILVHKWLYEVFEPERFDVVVFKNPEDPSLNYIKRLIGLPKEDVWLADGDVFVRPHGSDGLADQSKPWTIQRKSDRVQSSLWRTVFSSEYTPPAAKQVVGGVKLFEPPWIGPGWDVATQTYSTKEDSSVLSWNTVSWPIWDWVPYNDMRDNSRRDRWPVSDLRVLAGIRPEKAGLSLTATISARRHQFQGAIENGKAVLRMRPTVDATALGATGPADQWTTLGESISPLPSMKIPIYSPSWPTMAAQAPLPCLDGASSLYEAYWDGPLAWVLGAEGLGVSPELIAAAQLKLKIPMPGAVESLNVAAAAAICLFEALRRKLA